MPILALYNIVDYNHFKKIKEYCMMYALNVAGVNWIINGNWPNKGGLNNIFPEISTFMLNILKSILANPL